MEKRIVVEIIMLVLLFGFAVISISNNIAKHKRTTKIRKGQK